MRPGLEDAARMRGCQPENPVLRPGQFADAWEMLATEVHAIAIEHGWWEASRNDGELIALMHAELSEALEEWRKEDCNNERLAEELADCVIRVMDYAIARGLALGDAIETKVASNATRPWRHGGKRA